MRTDGPVAGLGHGANARIDEEGVVDPRYDQQRPTSTVSYREAAEQDAGDIAALHADSWRRHYRGAYLDSYLDGDVVADRLEVWTRRLAPPRLNQSTVIADGGGEVLGFAHTLFDDDPQWGALLDNLHVRSDVKGMGIGTHLLSHAAVRLLQHRRPGPVYLWVLDQNEAARSFYESRGGTLVESALRGPFPGGGRALGHRYFWSDASQLVVRDDGASVSSVLEREVGLAQPDKMPRTRRS
jgi:ribosomal protein S18 acetylase RimI-like enzyme